MPGLAIPLLVKDMDNIKTQASIILDFYRSLQPDFPLGEGIEVMNPFHDAESWKYTRLFYEKFYSDSERRCMIFGINPGRFGGGITGVPFTDPIRLKYDCGIDNPFQQKAELSSIFVYEVINAFGGAEKFYGRFFITALSPLGFTKNGINLNYYDDKQLLKDSEPFIVQCIREQIEIMDPERFCYCLGEGTNFKIFSKLNEKYKFFERIIPLSHPRWVMQYRRKRIQEFVDKYLQELSIVG